MRLTVSALLALCLATPALAQVITGRESSLNYNYVFGAGGDTRTGGDQRSRSNLLTSDSDSLDYFGSTSGTLPGGQPYNASVFCAVQHQYTVAGRSWEIDAITGMGYSSLSASTTGLGSAGVFAANPGNDVLLTFTVEQAVAYRLSGSLVQPDSGRTASVALQRYDGFTWQYVFYSLFLPAGTESFDVSGTFTPGQYRVRGNISMNASANTTRTASYTYTLDTPGLGGGFCPGDFNRDGFLDFFDYSDFVTCFETGVCGEGDADFNNDDFVDFFDYLDYVQAFEFGC